MEQLENLILGESDQLIAVENREEYRAAAIALTRQAQHSVYIYTPDLENPVYDNQEFVEAITNLITRRRRANIRILLVDATHAAKYGHRLVELYYRLNTFIKIRNPAEEYIDVKGSFLIVDETGFLYRKSQRRYQGNLSFNNRFEARKLKNTFDDLWVKGCPDPKLRRLHI